MRIISGDEIDHAGSARDLIETLRRAYRSSTIVPEPTRLLMERPVGEQGWFNLYPAWTDFLSQGHADRGYIGCRLAIDLFKAQQPTSGSSIYILFSGNSGVPIALIDGVRLSQRRRSAVLALATQYLAREDSQRLLVLSPPSFFPMIMQAYAAVRPIKFVLLEPEHLDMCRRLAAIPALSHISFSTSPELATAAQSADIIVLGEDAQTKPFSELPFSPDTLAEGVHIDMVGNVRDLVQPLNAVSRYFQAERTDEGDPFFDDVAADLAELTRGEKAGRRFYGQVTLFQEGQTAGLGDFAAAGHFFLRT